MTEPMNVRVDADLDARIWLRAHGYADVANLIAGIIDAWKCEGKKTRRDWWLILAGTVEGKPRVVSGISFPVLKAARRRQGLPPDVPGATENSKHELAPSIRRQERWGKSFKRALR